LVFTPFLATIFYFSDKTIFQKMNSFALHIPTQIFFGQDMLSNFVAASATLGKKALILMGGGSLEKLGYLAPLQDAFENAGVKTVVFKGIEPNPQAKTVNAAAKFARAEGVDFIIAFGGGSVIDAAKGIAVLLHEKAENIWEYVIGGSKFGTQSGAAPVAAIPTTAATGAEVTIFSVISDAETNGKSLLASPMLIPKTAFLNPHYTLSLNKTITQDGAADILSHVFENYILGGNDSVIADRHSEMVMLTVVETLPKLLKDLQNVSLRADLLWAADLALGGYQAVGRNASGFILHYIEHAASGFYPQLAHGRGLAILYPAYFRWLWENNRAHERFARLGAQIFGIEKSDKKAAALAFIERFEAWLSENGLYGSFSAAGVMPEKFEAIADYTINLYGGGQALDALGALSKNDILNILNNTEKQGKGVPA
jgi:alcohol dehydrogenase YqhD (iron-dependent ADH family)